MQEGGVCWLTPSAVEEGRVALVGVYTKREKEREREKGPGAVWNCFFVFILFFFAFLNFPGWSPGSYCTVISGGLGMHAGHKGGGGYVVLVWACRTAFFFTG